MWQPALTTAGGTIGGTGRPNRAQLAIEDDGFTTLYTKYTFVPVERGKVRVGGAGCDRWLFVIGATELPTLAVHSRWQLCAASWQQGIGEMNCH